MKVKCPIIGCSYVIEEGYFHYTKGEAIEKMLEHLKKRHTVAELWEFIECCVVDYFEREEKLEKWMRIEKEILRIKGR